MLAKKTSPLPPGERAVGKGRFVPMSLSSTPANRPSPDAVLIVGGGLTGLFTALKLAPLPVTVLAAAPIGQGASSAWAQGGIAAAVGPGDTVDKHVADTL